MAAQPPADRLDHSLDHKQGDTERQEMAPVEYCLFSIEYARVEARTAGRQGVSGSNPLCSTPSV
jgi:hypothetical protein